MLFILVRFEDHTTILVGRTRVYEESCLIVLVTAIPKRHRRTAQKRHNSLLNNGLCDKLSNS